MKKAIQAQLEKITHAVVERIKKDDDDSKPAPLTVFSGVKEKDKAEAIERLIVESTPRGDFFFLILLSVLMATFGLYADSPEVVIGSMLIAPLLSPILSLAMGVVMADQKLIARSLLTLLKAVIVAVLAAAVVAVFMSARVSATPELTTQMSARTRPDLVAAAIALIAGLAASLALVKTHLSAALPGVAVSVSLLPPLAVTGIGLAKLDWSVMARSFTLFALNAACIVFAGIIVFSMSRLYTKARVATKTVAEEEEKLEKGEA
jgi:uncharacterized hydrophobic protein (TIGR00271 family)